MKKKFFMPKSLGFILLNLFFELLTIMGIVLLIFDIINGKENNITMYILYVFSLTFLIYTSFRFIYGNIIIVKRNSIIRLSDLLPKFERIQYFCEIDFSVIKAVEIISSSTNSKKKYVKRIKGMSALYKYLEFTLCNNKKRRIAINFFTKNQVVKILNLIKDNMKLVNNENILDVDEIMKNWYVFAPNKKIKKVKEL